MLTNQASLFEELCVCVVKSSSFEKHVLYVILTDNNATY